MTVIYKLDTVTLQVDSVCSYIGNLSGSYSLVGMYGLRNMVCQYGSEKKPSAPDSGFVYPADYICADAGEESAICRLTRFSPGGRFPIEYILSVEDFCAAGEPPIPSGYDPSDVIGPDGKTDVTGLFDKNRQLALRAKYSEWCQCKSSPPPFTGGQCEINYIVSGTTTWNYPTGEMLYPSESFGSVVIGPIHSVQIDASRNKVVALRGNPPTIQVLKDSGGFVQSNLNFIVETIPGQPPDNCGDPGSPPPPPIEPPPPLPPVPDYPPFNIPIPPLITPSEPGPPGPVGPAGPRGATGPCPGLSGDVVVSVGGLPSMDINLVGDCEYSMNIVIPGIATETKMLLFGVEYVVNAYPSKASYNIQQNGLYFIPRSGALRFKKTGTDKVSENFEVHGEKGFVVNPRPGFYDSWEMTPFTGFQISVTKVEREAEVVRDIVFDNDG